MSSQLPPPPPSPSAPTGAPPPHQFPGGRSRQFQRANVVAGGSGSVSPTSTSGNNCNTSSQHLPSPPLPSSTSTPSCSGESEQHQHNQRIAHVVSPSTASPSLQQQQHYQHQEQVRPDHITIGGTQFPSASSQLHQDLLGQFQVPHADVDDHDPDFSDDDESHHHHHQNHQYHDHDRHRQRDHHHQQQQPQCHEASKSSAAGKQQRRAIRRFGSFHKLSSLSEAMEHWFLNDAVFHDAIKNFVRTLPRDLVGAAVAQREAVGADMLSVNLKAQEQHQKFCQLFEKHLEAMLESKNVDADAFAERVRLDKEEEERDGAHFYRWLEVIEFPQFVHLIAPSPKVLEDCNGDIGAAGLESLLQAIKQLSEEARRKFRKQSILAPLMWAWAPSSFASFDQVLQASLKQLGLVHHHHSTTTTASSSALVNSDVLHLSKTDAKSMLRWKAKLKTPVLNEHGVYAPPPVHHDEFVSYISAVTVGLDDELFDKFSVALRKEIKTATGTDEHRLDELKANNSGCVSSASALEEVEDLMIAIEQRLLLELFFELDVRHQGKIPLFSALKFMLQAGGLTSEKEIKRTMIKYKWTSQKQPGEVFLEQQQKEQELKRRRSSMQTSDSCTSHPVSGAASRWNSHQNLKHLASTVTAATTNPEDGVNDDEGDEQEDPADPLTTFHYFLAVVKEPLKAILKTKSVQKLLGHDVFDDINVANHGKSLNLSPLFVHHEEFVHRIQHLRQVWKDKQ